MTALSPQREHDIASVEHFIHWITPRLAGSPNDKETALVMILAQMDQAYFRGLSDAEDLTRRLSEVRPTRESTIIAKAVRELHERNRRDRPIVSLETPFQ